MRELLEQKLARYDELEHDLVNPEVLSNPARITAVAREHGSLGKLAKNIASLSRSPSKLSKPNR